MMAKGFLDLPLEVREMIYEYALSGRRLASLSVFRPVKRSKVRALGCLLSQLFTLRAQKAKPISSIFISRQCYDEAYHQLMKSATIEIGCIARCIKPRSGAKLKANDPRRAIRYVTIALGELKISELTRTLRFLPSL